MDDSSFLEFGLFPCCFGGIIGNTTWRPSAVLFLRSPHYFGRYSPVRFLWFSLPFLCSPFHICHKPVEGVAGSHLLARHRVSAGGPRFRVRVGASIAGSLAHAAGAMPLWKDKVAGKLSRLLAETPSAPSPRPVDSAVAPPEPQVILLDPSCLYSCFLVTVSGWICSWFVLFKILMAHCIVFVVSFWTSTNWYVFLPDRFLYLFCEPNVMLNGRFFLVWWDECCILEAWEGWSSLREMISYPVFRTHVDLSPFLNY